MLSEVLFYCGVVGSVIFAVIAVVLFIRLKIYSVIGELTGWTAKAGIRKLKTEGQGGTLSKTKSLHNGTTKIFAKKGKKKQEEKTTELEQNEGATTVLGSVQDEATVVLTSVSSGEEECETTVLKGAQYQKKYNFNIEKEVSEVHSDEEI